MTSQTKENHSDGIEYLICCADKGFRKWDLFIKLFWDIPIPWCPYYHPTVTKQHSIKDIRETQEIFSRKPLIQSLLSRREEAAGRPLHLATLVYRTWLNRQHICTKCVDSCEKKKCDQTPKDRIRIIWSEQKTLTKNNLWANEVSCSCVYHQYFFQSSDHSLVRREFRRDWTKYRTTISSLDIWVVEI